MQVSTPEPPAALPAAQSRPVAAGEGVRPLVLVHNFELQVLEGEIAHLRVVAAAVGEVAVQLLERLRSGNGTTDPTGRIHREKDVLL